MVTPDDRRYFAEHTWAQTQGDVATVGITDHAQEELGDIVYIELPKLDAAVQQGSSMGEIESVKTVSDLISPVTGTVVERNEATVERPETINSDPYGAGWLVRVRLTDAGEATGLLSAADYLALTRS